MANKHRVKAHTVHRHGKTIHVKDPKKHRRRRRG